GLPGLASRNSDPHSCAPDVPRTGAGLSAVARQRHALGAREAIVVLLGYSHTPAPAVPATKPAKHRPGQAQLVPQRRGSTGRAHRVPAPVLHRLPDTPNHTRV